MAGRDREPVEKYHDRVAGIYDTIYERKPYWEAVFELTWKHILKFLPRDQSTRCLDVGCGTGRWGLKLLKTGYDTDFLDISLKMLEQVRKKLEAGEGGNRQYRPLLYHASIDDLSEVPDGAYGFVVGQGDPLNCAQRPEKALKELERVLKPGGVMLMSVDNRYAGIYHYFRENDLAGLREFIRTGVTNWVTDDDSERYPMTMFTPEGIRKMLAKRGLELLDLRGKCVLPLRRFAETLEDKEKRAELLKLEESLCRVEALLGGAAHLEFVVRKTA